MKLISYYQETLAPVLVVLILGLACLASVRRSSAATKQFVCSAILLSTFLVGFVPIVPRSVTPSLPVSLQPIMAWQHAGNNPSISPIDPASGGRPIAPVTRIDFLPLLGWLAAGVSLYFALRLARSLVAVSLMRRKSLPASERIRSMATGPVRLVVGLSSPIACGGLRPMVLLPSEAESWTDEALNAILIHEQAHILNGDPYWQILAEVVCVTNWFNPLVWYVRNVMRNSAERAADDAVIRAGIQPSRYAESLVGFATDLTASKHSYAWTTFARKQGIKARVQAILSSKVKRTPIGRSAKITSILAVAVAAYGASAFARQQGNANPTSPYEDIRSGKTIAARASNGFIGRLADGREVEVLQISRQMDNGKVLVWKPDGSPIAKADAIPLKYHPLKKLDTHVRYVVLRFQEAKNRISDPNAGCGSGGSSDHDPSVMSFCGGGIISHKDGYYTIVSYIGLPKEDAERFPIGFGVSDTQWQPAAIVNPTDKALANVRVAEVSEPKKGDLEKEAWWKDHKPPYTMVEFDYLSKGIVGDLQVRPVFRDSGQKFEESKMYGSFGRYVGDSLRCRYYFAYRLADVVEYRIQTRSSLNCEIYDLAANPRNTR